MTTMNIFPEPNDHVRPFGSDYTPTYDRLALTDRDIRGVRLDRAIRVLITDLPKILAIKVLRDLINVDPTADMGLREAKETVDLMKERMIVDARRAVDRAWDSGSPQAVAYAQGKLDRLLA
jgi:hypothetical protein